MVKKGSHKAHKGHKEVVTLLTSRVKHDLINYL